MRRYAVLVLLALTLGAQQKPFVPGDFKVPEMYVSKQGTFKLKPLGPKFARRDYDAYMSSIEHLQKTFSGSTRWPNANVTFADAMKDVEGEEASFTARKKFTYAVLNPVESQELGCVYIGPSNKEGYDAVVRYWVIETHSVTGFDKKLADEMKLWVKSRWPFEKVAFVGSDISREDFMKLPAKAK